MKIGLTERSLRALATLAIAIACVSCEEQPPMVQVSEPQSAPKERGEFTIYVPAYAYVTGAAQRRVPLVTTLTIHNVATRGRVTLRSVEYHAPLGNHITSYLGSTQILDPLQTSEFIVGKADNASGIGCNFIVTYDLEEGTPQPLVEAVMIGNSGTGVLSVTSRGILVEEVLESNARP